MDYKFESKMQELKYQVLKQAALIGFNDIQSIDQEDIATTILPGPKSTFRCCIHKEHAIIKERLKYALHEKNDEHIVNVIEEACDQCPIDRYTVTNSCRGCIARSCEVACPVDAVTILAGRAYINQEKCIECGRCANACQFNAISDVERPCKRSCPVDAITMDENKIAKIDYKKCISCGQCAYNCPFGAITDISDVKEVAYNLNHSEKHVYALIAPSISSQFDKVTIGQITHALKSIGFTDVIEVALGADMVIKHESTEFIHRMETDSYMTTSCCPAFVEIVDTKFTDQKKYVSTTVSPMVALGRLVKDLHPDAINVFIGPCMAKKGEARKEGLKDAIDQVITFEELRSLLGAKEINVKDMPIDPLDNASYFGRIFAVSKGVSGAIKNYIEQNNLDVDYKPVAANGAKECIKMLNLAKFNKLPGNFIEGMACEGGCIGGPGSITHTKKDATMVQKYANEALERTTNDSLQIINSNTIIMETK